MYTLKYVNDNGMEIIFDLKSGFVISSITNMSSIPVEISLSQGIGQVGGTVQRRSIQSKDLVVTGEIVGRVGDKREHLLHTVLPGVKGRLIYNGRLELDVETVGSPDVDNRSFNSRFVFTARAPYPYWRNSVSSIVDLAGLIPRFTFPVNFAEPFIWGERTPSLFANVYNDGNVPVNFILTFFANTPLDNPKITNASTYEIIRIKRHMVAGELITVDMTVSPMRITSTLKKVNSNIFGALDFMQSTPFTLAVGDNIIRYDADTNPDGLDCRIRFRRAVSGPY